MPGLVDCDVNLSNHPGKSPLHVAIDAGKLKFESMENNQRLS